MWCECVPKHDLLLTCDILCQRHRSLARARHAGVFEHLAGLLLEPHVHILRWDSFTWVWACFFMRFDSFPLVWACFLQVFFTLACIGTHSMQVGTISA